MSNIKIANNDFPIIDLIKNRWSARAFNGNPIGEKEFSSLLEAARWAPSANNEQPWMYLYAPNGTEGFDKIWECLMPGNQPWNKKAGGFIVTMAQKNYEKNQQPNPFAEHDLGLANTNILLQATSMGIYCHPMAGFDKAKLKQTFQIGEDQNPVCIIALGYLDSPESLEEPFKERELTPRSRKSIEVISKRV